MASVTAPKTAAERSASYRARHPEAVRESARRYRKQNSEKVNRLSLDWHHANPARKLYYLSKRRAKKNGLLFNLEVQDIVVPDRCPVLGIELRIGGSGQGFSDNSPTLDRIDNTKGYVKDNVAVISWRANRIKCDATYEEIEAVARYMRGKRWRA